MDGRQWKLHKVIRSEWRLFPVWGVVLVAGSMSAGARHGAIGDGAAFAVFLVLFVTVLAAAFAVVRHAEALAHRLGEPYGTLLLTLAVITMEVSIITAVMVAGKDQPTMARDTLYAVIMLLMNGLVGVALLMGGLRHREQVYNLNGTGTYLALILPLSVIALVLPNYTHATRDPTFSLGQAAVVGTMTLVLYAIFLAVQTVRHRDFFDPPDAAEAGHLSAPVAELPSDGSPRAVVKPSILMLLYLVPVILLAKFLAGPIEHGISDLGWPIELGGVLIAALILSPEALSALRAALDNELQRAINVFLGSVTATIGLTVPAVLGVSLITGEPLLLGLNAEQSLLLFLTLAVSMVTYSSGRTNVLLGAVHLTLFAVYLMLVFDLSAL
jgi:Ca2+:H+ antiporter